jgi:hypothetical protein
MDQGNFADAQRLFGEALQADPDFAAAQTARTEAEGLVQISEVSPFMISSRTGSEFSPPAISGSTTQLGVLTTGTASSLSSLLEATTEGVVPGPAGPIVDLGSVLTGADLQSIMRDPIQEVQGQEGVTEPATVSIRITIRLPGGGD